MRLGVRAHLKPLSSQDVAKGFGDQVDELEETALTTTDVCMHLDR